MKRTGEGRPKAPMERAVIGSAITRNPHVSNYCGLSNLKYIGVYRQLFDRAGWASPG